MKKALIGRVIRETHVCGDCNRMFNKESLFRMHINKTHNMKYIRDLTNKTMHSTKTSVLCM